MDVDVFKQRFLPFHPKLYRIAYALLDNKADAEDILQDAYCKLWNKRDELGDIQNGIEDCSYEDIEQITGLSSSNIRTLLSRARKLIREKLEKASCHG